MATAQEHRQNRVDFVGGSLASFVGCQARESVRLAATVHNLREIDFISPGRQLRGAVWIGLAVALTGCFARGDQGEGCERPIDCRGELQCYRGKCSLPDLCRRSPSCAKRGVCTAWGHACTVGADRDCLFSDVCATQGLCRAVDGACAATADHDCARAASCRDDGACLAVNGACTRGGRARAHCGERCDIWGQCSIDSTGQCVVASDVDCRQSLVCQRDGRCVRPASLPDGATEVACGVDDAGCAASELCKAIGACRAIAGKCAPASDKLCAASRACATTGACSFLDGVCVPHGADCRRQPTCADRGLCTGISGRCQAVTSSDCEASTQCRAVGVCSAHNGGCEALLAEDCLGSLGCRAHGKCTARDGVCVLGGRADCLLSEPCQQLGLCSPVGGKCQVISRADCILSQACKQVGRCRPVSPLAERLAGWSPDRTGVDLAHEATALTCGVRAHSDCRDSALCVDSHRCWAWRGACITRQQWRAVRDAADTEAEIER